MKKTCHCLGPKSLLRRTLANLVLNKYFDDFVSICIVINSVMIALRDYTSKLDSEHESSWNDLVETFDQGFTVVYVFECVAKMIVMGFW